METPRHDGLDTSNDAIEDGINNAMRSLDQEEHENNESQPSVNNEDSKSELAINNVTSEYEEPKGDLNETNGDFEESKRDFEESKEDFEDSKGELAINNVTSLANPKVEEDEVQEVEQNQDTGEWQKVHMEYAVKRPQLHLWKYIQELQGEAGCKVFYDIDIYCKDGVISWNRLLLALCHPEFHFLIYPDERDEVMVHLPETTGEDLLKVLKNAVDTPPIMNVEAVDPDAEVKYTLVQHVWPKDYDYPILDWDDGGLDDGADDDDEEYQPGAWLGPAGTKVKTEPKMEPEEIFQQTCEVCDKEFFNADQFADHAKVHDASLIRYTCGIATCGENFIMESLYQIHVKAHEKELKDAEVDQKARELMEQIEPESGPKLWKCIECGFSNRLKFTVITHCEVHLDVKHTCHICDATCRTRNALRTHMYRKHPEAIERSRPAAPARKTKDVDDDYSSDGSEYEPLEYDERATDYVPRAKRQKRQPYERTCPTCHETFTLRKAFEDHAKVHNPDLIKFTCDQCLEGFIVESELKKHMKMHKVERTKALGEQGIEQELVNMVTTLYEESENKMYFQCTFCGYKNLRKVAVMEHAEKHINNIAHQCPVCQHVAPTKNALRVHTVRKHQTSKWLSLNKPKPPSKRGRGRRNTNTAPQVQHVIHYTPQPQTPQTPNSNYTNHNTPYSGFAPSPAPSSPANPPVKLVQMHPCPHCHKSSPTKNALRVHIARYHKEIDQDIKKEYYNNQDAIGRSIIDAARELQQQQQQQQQQRQQQRHQPPPTPEPPQHHPQHHGHYQNHSGPSPSPHRQNLPAPKPTKQPQPPQFTQLRPPAAHSGQNHNQAHQVLPTPQQSLALQAQQAAFPDFFWNKY